ncbi:PEP-CTERM sorting domain-containing protein [Coraliomargarita akajimensis]|uniref:Ice-binding protein C-terminal domain-containing protein n=1 Tax=Coraliomargarita akajimensis (strain DSM 45221 / IAM 15411 / JCM 23193 / KCTC 12865 / 04OKA010-24) TaxID=583355 RepID=D5EQV1_CORAD|nr:PEP-CTERM sorting domain-containing protein [Coraliomargarita akajimensis]ADE53944.1 protein of unknown function DUF1555 [Coraliomargarita akajimensis DSM 45221]
MRTRKLKLISSIAALATLASTQLSAIVLLEVDLSVNNQITISATTGTSAVTLSGSDFTGYYLDSFFSSTSTGDVNSGSSLLSGNLTSSLDTSNSAPTLYRDGGTDTGLNVYSYTSDGTSDFTAGVQAFTGSATWTVDAAVYALALAGPSSGDIYFVADDVTDIAGAQVLGQWQSIAVPEPSTAALLLGLVAFGSVMHIRRRR